MKLLSARIVDPQHTMKLGCWLHCRHKFCEGLHLNVHGEYSVYVVHYRDSLLLLITLLFHCFQYPFDAEVTPQKRGGNIVRSWDTSEVLIYYTHLSHKYIHIQWPIAIMLKKYAIKLWLRTRLWADVWSSFFYWVLDKILSFKGHTWWAPPRLRSSLFFRNQSLYPNLRYSLPTLLDTCQLIHYSNTKVCSVCMNHKSHVHFGSSDSVLPFISYMLLLVSGKHGSTNRRITDYDAKDGWNRALY